jgi:hypothetical protein
VCGVCLIPGEMPNLCVDWTYERVHLAPFSATRVFRGAVKAVVGIKRLGSIKHLDKGDEYNVGVVDGN